MTDKLFEQTKPQCIGRYLFDVPVSFNNVAMGQVKINEMRITASGCILRHLHNVSGYVNRS
ncbi:TPA: hypothetical protein QCJ50_000764 [Enterobacter mori]|nr:hypothetical protein [Enterobacter mori]MEB7916617.1 hypothetical protein [Enterobacter mori]HDR2706532.1 hypothetical protein [Enterobacter mori]